MRSKYILIFLLIPFIATSQCDQFSYYFTSDSEIEEFIEMNPECKTIIDLTINGSDITNLALLSSIDTIHYLSVSNNDLIKDLDFLDSIEILMSINLRNLMSLESLSKLNNTQPENMIIVDCPLITSIELGRSDYNSITLNTPNFNAVANHSISIKNLSISNSVDFLTAERINLNQLWLLGATSYSSFTSLTNDFSMDTLSALTISTDYLNSEGFPDSMVCNSIDFRVKNLDINGFINKNAFFKSFRLYSISNLKDLRPFDKMHTKTTISIKNCDSLSSLDGIPVSDYINSIIIIDNPLLVDINDINKLDALNAITIQNSPMLSVCNIDPICDLISLPFSANRTKFSGNKTTCYDLPSVTESCMMRDPVICSASFLGTTLYDYDQVDLAFDLLIPESAEENCIDDQKIITMHLDGAERKEIYSGTISPSDTDATTLNVQISNTDLLNENYDCIDISVQGSCSKENCNFYICQILNREVHYEPTGISLYPNPAYGSVTINSDIDFKTNISNINGRVLKSINLNTGTNLIPIDDLQAGVYFIYDGRQSYKKLIVY